jgi:MFS family permease
MEKGYENGTVPTKTGHPTIDHPHSLSSLDIFSPTVSLPILVFIDMFAVALVVPLLFQYYKYAGVTSATQRELLSSVFSASQIVGGILLGTLTDAGILSKKTVLFVSFGGSALAYLMITYGGFTALVLSRIMVGLVKQTMTITTSMLTKCTSEDTRAKHMGRLESSATAAWILGPSTGAVLFKCTIVGCDSLM